MNAKLPLSFCFINPTDTQKPEKHLLFSPVSDFSMLKVCSESRRFPLIESEGFQPTKSLKGRARGCARPWKKEGFPCGTICGATESALTSPVTVAAVG